MGRGEGGVCLYLSKFCINEGIMVSLAISWNSVDD